MCHSSPMHGCPAQSIVYRFFRVCYHVFLYLFLSFRQEKEFLAHSSSPREVCLPSTPRFQSASAPNAGFCLGTMTIGSGNWRSDSLRVYFQIFQEADLGDPCRAYIRSTQGLKPGTFGTVETCGQKHQEAPIIGNQN